MSEEITAAAQAAFAAYHKGAAGSDLVMPDSWDMQPAGVQADWLAAMQAAAKVLGALESVPAAAPELAAAMAETRRVQDVLARILSGAVKGSSGWVIRIGQVPLARAWAAAGGPVPEELRRFL